MSQLGAHERAGLWRRAAARAIDTLAMIVLAALSLFVGVIAMVVVLLLPFTLLEYELWGNEAAAVGWILVVLACLVAAVGYEVASTARRGQTPGKALARIRVVRWHDKDATVSDPPRLATKPACFERWAVGHLPATVATAVPLVVALTTIHAAEALVAVVAGVAAWLLVYGSSLLDRNRRGWHDKAAGTVVVRAGDDHPFDLREPDWSPPPDREDPTKRPPGPAASQATAPNEPSQSWGLVSDYYQCG